MCNVSDYWEEVALQTGRKEGWKEDLDNVDDDDPAPPPESWIDFRSWDDPSRIKCKTKETEDNVYITGFTNQDIEKSDLQVEFPG